MRVLLVGGGGREHALAWKIAQSPLLTSLVVAPGNPGIAALARCAAVAADDVSGLTALAMAERVDLVVVGPEAALVGGLTDRLALTGIACFGPTSAASRLEASKGFMKDLCAKHGIPTAAYARFTDAAAAEAHVAECPLPVVIKADGLASGKGVIIANTREEAVAAVRAALVEHEFGAAGTSLVIEEFLEGEEVSLFALSDGVRWVPFGSARDHKHVGVGDTGPMTGGMGAYSPAAIMTPTVQARAEREIIEPLLKAMLAEGTPFRGVLFAGLIVTPEGAPKLLEVNVRFGDPECEVLLPRFSGDLLALLNAAATGHLDEVPVPTFDDSAALTVILASHGYPGRFRPRVPIPDLSVVGRLPGTLVFHAGTAFDMAGDMVSSGGRVLAATAVGADLAEAHERAYAALKAINWDGGFYRPDIGWNELYHAHDLRPVDAAKSGG